jgi:hypothetical protein
MSPDGTMNTHRHRAQGLPNWWIIRQADDLVILAHRTRNDTGELARRNRPCSRAWADGSHNPWLPVEL